MSMSTIAIIVLIISEIIGLILYLKVVKKSLIIKKNNENLLSEYNLLENVYYNLLKLMKDNMSEEEIKSYISNSIKITTNGVGVNLNDLEDAGVVYEDMINDIYEEISNIDIK
jgi:hypothetical protein